MKLLANILLYFTLHNRKFTLVRIESEIKEDINSFLITAIAPPRRKNCTYPHQGWPEQNLSDQLD